MKDYFRRYIKDDGILIVSGIIEERLDEVVDAIKSAGFRDPEISLREGWAAVKFTL
jgi:ribosomal protein L11 methyltransferase